MTSSIYGKYNLATKSVELAEGIDHKFFFVKKQEDDNYWNLLRCQNCGHEMWACNKDFKILSKKTGECEILFGYHSCDNIIVENVL